MGRRVVFDTTFRSYVNPEHIVCAACGKMIPKEAWVVGKQGKEFFFCNEECEGIFDYMERRRARKEK
ncbi:MAG: hypothetical protein JRI90_05260 [Deltaproteobacteria bacterium]|nr:hypothetical protein [Deltaproteobacteria bacterium]